MKKSTKQTNHGKGMEVCLSFQRAEDLARRGAMTEAKARQVINEIVERATGETLHFNTTRQWLETWLAGKTRVRAKNTGLRYKLAINAFLDHLGAKADKTIAAVSVRDVLNFRDSRTSTGVAPATANHDVSVVSAAFKAARRQGLLTSNPVEAVEMLRVVHEERQAFTANPQLLKLGGKGAWPTVTLLR